MHIEGNQIVLGERPCIMCNSTGNVKPFQMCPRSGNPTYGKPCELCGGKNRGGHTGIPGKLPIECSGCDGTGRKAETLYDSLPDGLLEQLAFKFVDARATDVSWLEGLFGAGLYTSVDYGRHWELSEDALLDKVLQDARHVQAVKIADRNTGTLCQYVAVVRRQNGYVVIAVTADGKAIV